MVKRIVFCIVVVLYSSSLRSQSYFALSQHEELTGSTNKEFPKVQNGESESIIWSENFSNGIPTTWNNTGGLANGVADADCKWEYRGPSTTPGVVTGSRGGYATGQLAIQSPTAANGFVLFDSDFLDNAGIGGNFGFGIAPAPHLANLTSGVINLTSYTHLNLVFNQYYRRFGGPTGQGVPATYIDFSINGGTTWPFTVMLNSGIAVNDATTRTDVATVPIPSAVAGQANVKFRFRFEGNYYYWQIDDIRIIQQPQTGLTAFGISGTSPIDIHISGSKTGHSTISQARPTAFKAGIFNSGLSNINNVRLATYILSAQNTIIDIVQSPPTNLVPGDSAILTTTSWLPTESGVYGVYYRVLYNNGSFLSISDTISMIIGDEVSLDFSSWDNSIGTTTSSWGSGSSVTQLLEVKENDRLNSITIWLGTGTQVGSSMLVQVFDSSAFTFIGTSGGNAWDMTKLRGSISHTISAADVSNGFAVISFASLPSQGVPLYATVRGYYVHVVLYGSVTIRNDQTFEKAPGSGYMYLANLNGWFTGYSSNRNFNNLWIRSTLNGCFGNVRIVQSFVSNLWSASSLVLTAVNGGNLVWDDLSTNRVRNVNNPTANSIYYVSSTKPGCVSSDTLAIRFVNVTFQLNVGNAVIDPNKGVHIAGNFQSWNPSSTALLDPDNNGIYSVTVPLVAGNPYVYYKFILGDSWSDLHDILPGPCMDPLNNNNRILHVPYIDYILPPVSLNTCSVNQFPDPLPSTITACTGPYTINLSGSLYDVDWYFGGAQIANDSSIFRITTSGYYRIQALNPWGAAYFDTVFVNIVIPNATISVVGSLNFCVGGSSQLSAPAGYGYLWSTGSTSQSISVSSSGVYSVTLFKNGCSLTSPSKSIVVTPLPPNVITASSSLNICQGNSVTLSAPSGFSYAWSNGSSNQSIVVNTAGSYSVIVSNGICTNTSPAQVVTIIPGPSSLVTSSGPMTICPGGSVTLSAPAGYSYLWSNGATTQSITATAAGSYTVTVSQNGCSSTSAAQVVTVNSGPPSTVSASGPMTFCQGGSVTLSAPAGYSYLWSNGATTQSITPTTSGSYSVVVSVNGCSSTSSTQMVTVNPLPPSTVTASGALTFCQGGSVTLSAPAGYSYLWNTGATTQTLSPSTSGSYSVVVTENGCSSTSAAQVVTINPLPPSTVSASGPLTLCQGGSVTLSAPAGYSYLWNNGATTQSITASASGSYSVMVSANGCSSTSAAQAVTVNPLPPSTVSASGPLTFCQGGSVTLSAPAGYSYLWSNGATTQSITASASGTYSVVVSANGCSSTSAAQAVTVNPLPSSTVSASGPLTLCQGSSVTLSAPAGYSYLWNNGATTQSITASTAGSYSVTVSANGCSSTSSTQAVTVNPLPPSTVTSSGAMTFCQGGSVTLSAPAGYSYLWSTGATTQTISPNTSGSYSVVVSANGCNSTSAAQVVTVHPIPPSSVAVSGPLTFCQGSSVTLSAPAGYSYLWSNGATTQGITATATGSYFVTVSANGCSSTSTAQQVTVHPLPPASVTASGPLTLCQGSSVTLSAPAGYSYLWSNGATTQSISVSASGSYGVTVSANGCSSNSTSQVVTVNPTPPSNVVASGPLTFCQGGSVALVAPSGYAYVWSNGATTQSINATTSGTFTVTVYGNGCSSTSAPVQVSVIPNPSAAVTASGSLSFCQGGSVTLVAPAGGTYLWSNGAITQSISVTSAGVYSVVVTANGCSTTSANQQVNVLPVPPATVTASGSLTFCEGGSVGLMAPAGFSYAWSTGATTQSIVASATGAYSVTVSDNTCSATSSPVAVTAVVNNLTPQVFGTTLANVNTIQSYFTSQNLGNGYTWGVQGGSVVTGQGTNAVTVFMGTSGNVKVFVMETNGYCSEGDTLVVKVSGLGMEEEGIQGRLRVYPVPSNGTFTVVPPSTEGILQVVDMVGRLIHQEPITSEKMTIEGVPPGVYTVLAYTNGLRSECRMVVQ